MCNNISWCPHDIMNYESIKCYYYYYYNGLILPLSIKYPIYSYRETNSESC